MSTSEDLRRIGSELGTATAAQIAEKLRADLNHLLGTRFKVVSGVGVDNQGQKAEVNGLLVCSLPSVEGAAVPANGVACAIEVCESLDLEKLRASYQRITDAKRLKKTLLAHVPGAPHTTTTLGLVFALQTSIPLEQLADELDRLNRQNPSEHWPDMIVVLSSGVIHYAVQFPGDQQLAGYLPPTEGALANYVPPIYVVMLISPTQDYTFNKMYFYLITHLALFSPGAIEPSARQKSAAGIPPTAMTFGAYQYNLSGQLVPVPEESYIGRHIPPHPVMIADDQGKVLCGVQFLPWQDGGVILLRGKLPLEALLLFLGKGPVKQRIIKHSDVQLSNVLAITHEDFVKWLGTIQQRSNMKILRKSPQMVFQKFANEGTSTPFIARVHMGLLTLRDKVFPDEPSRRDFDTHFDFVLTQLFNARATAQEIKQAWIEHERKVSTGEVAQITPGSIQINESVDNTLGKQVDDFLNGTVRALKHGMQSLTKTLQVDVGFLFQNAKELEKGLSALEKTDRVLADYLRASRDWTEPLQESRNAIEHKGWKLPRVTYSPALGKVHVKEPEILSMPVTKFVERYLDRVICFVEEVTAHCLQAKMVSRGMTLTEIPLAQRVQQAPERFQPTLLTGGMETWKLSYHESRFEQT